MDKIHVNGMSFYGYHGVFPEENKLGQRFFVDLTIELDLREAGQNDRMEDSIDYGQIYEVTKKVVEGEAKKLVETVAENISASLFSTFPRIEAINVHVKKPEAPIPGQFQSVSIEIYREKSK